MKKILTLALLLVLLPLSSFAAVDTAVVEGVVYGGSNASATAYTQFLDGGTTVQYTGPTFSVAGITTTQQLYNAAQAAIIAHATGSGWTLNTIVWPFLSPDETQTLIDNSIAEVTTSKVVVATGTVEGGSGAVSIDISSAGLSNVTAVVWESNDDTALYSFGTKAQSTSAVSAVVKKQTTASTNVLLNLLGGLVSVITGVSQTAAPNGTSVRAIVIGS